MCGICGIVGRPDPAILARMSSKLAHRGPDDSGEFLDDSAALGFRRLSVIDVEGGHQPMRGCRPLHLVFNGEIYNFRELRERLSDHPFRTRSDSEVILHLYEEKGEACVEDLEGMFSFAIWDEERRTLFAARDRFGKKPFVYWRSADQFVFSSELDSLLQHPGIPRTLDRNALGAYLTYLVVPAPMTMFEGIRKLPPGHCLSWDGTLTIRRYWEARVEPAPFRRGETESRIRAALGEAVRKRMVADVPVGAFLSGGVDSSIVVALMAEAGRKVKTFSIGFPEEEFSELEHARVVADRFGTDHRELVVRPDAIEALPELVKRYGEPFADSSAIPTFLLSRMTREHVTVALSGDGGDECFGGYLRYRAVEMLTRLRRMPRPFLKVASLFFPHATERGERMRRLLHGGLRSPGELYLDLVTFFTPEMKSLLGVEEEWADRILEPFGRFPGDPVTAAGYTDLVTYLPDDLLVKVDIASMANGLEVRSPFLDPAVVDLAFRIPGREKRSKSVLKSAFADLLPPSILHRKKMGFGVPLARWLREDLRELMTDTLLGKAARERAVFRPEMVEILVREHLSGERDHRDRLWILLMFELWAERYL